MQGKRVLVTGAGGFIGRWSVPALRARGFEVHAVLSGKADREVPAELGGATIHVADLLNDRCADELMGEVSPTHLLHFAWIAVPGVYWSSPENFRWVEASERLLRSFGARGGRRVMMAGTCAEYDWSRAGECDELRSPLADDTAAAPSPYASCKIAMQRALAEFGRREQVSTAWGRIFFQFGPYEHPDRLVPFVIRQSAAGSRGTVLAREADSKFSSRGRRRGRVRGGAGRRTRGSREYRVRRARRLADLIERIGRQIGRSDLVRLGARPPRASEPPLLVPRIAPLARRGAVAAALHLG